VQVGDLLRKKGTGQLCLFAEHAERKYGSGWIKVFINGALSKWVYRHHYEVINESR